VGQGLTTNLDLGGSSAVSVVEDGSVYNLDSAVSGDSFIGPGDFAFFAPCWMAVSPLGVCDAADFDCDGVVGPGDLSFFATAWLRNEADPAIIVPACQLNCAGQPLSGGGGLPQRGATLPWASPQVMEQFGLPLPPPEWRGWELDPSRSKGESPPRRAERKSKP
jgi:hypothetical protein